MTQNKNYLPCHSVKQMGKKEILGLLDHKPVIGIWKITRLREKLPVEVLFIRCRYRARVEEIFHRRFFLKPGESYHIKRIGYYHENRGCRKSTGKGRYSVS